MIARLRWWLADRLRPNVWPSTAAQHGILLERIKELEGQRDHELVRATSALFVLSMIAKGIPFRGKADPREAAQVFLDSSRGQG